MAEIVICDIGLRVQRTYQGLVTRLPRIRLLFRFIPNTHHIAREDSDRLPDVGLMIDGQ